MNRAEYIRQVQEMNQLPPSQERPEGQKFNIGDIVRIANPLNWYSKKYTPDQLFKVEYSYLQKYGTPYQISIANLPPNDRKPQYSLIHLFENNSSAWYDEEELELVEVSQ